MNFVEQSLENWNNRILIVDDNKDIHEDYHKILDYRRRNENELALDDFESSLFGDDDDFSGDIKLPPLELTSAYQGKDALELQEKAHGEGRPFAVVFMDVRMPPGWDGIVTAERIWHKFPFTEIVIVTAFSDYSWNSMIQKLGISEHLLYLKKPFDGTTVKQMALNLLNKWNNAQRAREYIKKLEREVQERTSALDKAIKSM